MEIKRFGIDGMTCAGCAPVISRAISEMGGVRNAVVSFESRDATIEFDERITSPEKLRLAVMSAGYDFADTADLPRVVLF